MDECSLDLIFTKFLALSNLILECGLQDQRFHHAKLGLKP